MPGEPLAARLVLREALEGAKAGLDVPAPDVACGLWTLRRQAQEATEEAFTGAEGTRHAYIVGALRRAKGAVVLQALATRTII